MRVWDPYVRVVHWLLAIAVLLAWLTREGWGLWHDWLGYAALALTAARLPWGWFGPRHARFADFLYAPGHTLAYARSFLTATAPRYLGHNPLGAERHRLSRNGAGKILEVRPRPLAFCLAGTA